MLARTFALYTVGAMPSRPNVPDDPTPIVASATDIAALSRSGTKPSHKRTAEEELDVANWKELAASDKFRELLRAKYRFIVPAVIVFLIYYFALPALVGYAPRLMERRVVGAINIAYLFALSQFFMAWLIAALYVRAAARFDRMAADVTQHKEG